MSGIIRSWICGNSRCAADFDSWEPNPSCPKCRCVRVNWRPNGGHIAGVAKAADADLRALADVFRMGDMHSAERGRAAKVVAPQRQVAAGPAVNFGPGFVAPIDPNGARTSENPSGAQCLPTSARLDFKARAGIGQALTPSGVFPSVRTNTAIEAAHKP